MADFVRVFAQNMKAEIRPMQPRLLVFWRAGANH